MQAQQTRLDEPTAITPTGCCPPFQPQAWDEKEVTWHDKPFVKEHVPCFLHVPLGVSRKVTKQMAMVSAAGAQSDRELMLFEDTSPWSSELLIPVTKPVAGAVMQELSGTFLTKVFEGPYRNAGDWMERMKAYAALRQREVEKIYIAYAACPKCAKVYGKNYVVLFAKVRDAGKQQPS